MSVDHHPRRDTGASPPVDTMPAASPPVDTMPGASPPVDTMPAVGGVVTSAASVTSSTPAAAVAPARSLRWLALATGASMGLLLAGAFLYAPTDAVQGPPQRIFYIHVPSAWVSFVAFFVVFVASIGVLARRSRACDRVAAASAEVGVVFTTAVLLTGPLWARPIWGVYWSWDPRLTSFFMLWLLYLSYLSLRRYVTEPSRRARYCAVLGIVAFLDIPVVYLSVRWWRTLHPGPVVAAPEGPQLPVEMLAVLLVGVAAFTLLYLLLLRLRVDNAVREDQQAEALVRGLR